MTFPISEISEIEISFGAISKCINLLNSIFVGTLRRIGDTNRLKDYTTQVRAMKRASRCSTFSKTGLKWNMQSQTCRL